MEQGTLTERLFEKLAGLERVMHDLPAALKSQEVRDEHLVAWEVLYVVDPRPPVTLYWAFIRAAPVFADESAETPTTADEAAAAAAPVNEGTSSRTSYRKVLCFCSITPLLAC